MITGYSRRGPHYPAYRSWACMLTRCYCETDQHFPDYGGRGITVCDRWRESFANFFEDMGDKPEDRTLDRIDNDGNYEPSNCRWATPREQAINRRNTVWIEINGEKRTILQWCEHFGTRFHAVRSRLRRGWNPIKAVSTPSR